MHSRRNVSRMDVLPLVGRRGPLARPHRGTIRHGRPCPAQAARAPLLRHARRRPAARGATPCARARPSEAPASLAHDRRWVLGGGLAAFVPRRCHHPPPRLRQPVSEPRQRRAAHPKVSGLGLLEPAGRRFGGGAWGAFCEKCVPDGRRPVGWAPPGHPRPARRHLAHCCTWRREALGGMCAKIIHGARGRQCARAPGHAAHFHDGRDESVPAMCRASSLPCYSAWACPSPPRGRHAAGVCCDGVWKKKT